MGRLHKEDKAGLYITVIFHLAVIIVLLISQIGIQLSKENTFVLDFTKQEEAEKVKKEVELKEDIARKLDELLAASAAGAIPVRNIAVNRGALKDDRGTDADQLYKDAERLQKDLDMGVQDEPDEDYADLTPKNDTPTKKKEESHYSGPSIVSYELDGRKASKLSIPAYRCMGAGMVTVIITVDNAGNVINAKVQDEMSSPDGCLRSFAIRAARGSRFSASPTAPARQVGNIVYQFIAQ